MTPGSGTARDAPADAVEVRADRVSAEFVAGIPLDFARTHLIISQGRRNGAETLAVGQYTDPAAVLNTGVHLDVAVDPVVADDEAIARAIDEVYAHAARDEDETPEVVEDGASEIDRLLAEADRDLLSTDGKGPIVKLVDALLFEALGREASDVHVQPVADRTLVRYRLDGVLHTARELPVKLAPGIVSRIKVMGRMDIAERRVPQDGRATVTIGRGASGGNGRTGRSIDLRISTLPTTYGERAVIRLLDRTNQLCEFDALGMPDDVAERYLEHASRASGIILLTGPTGSGKTTTLYATLLRVGSPGVNIMTIEDPVEYELSSNGLTISQSQIDPRKGVTFARGLRHILRQDPDVVMVGEIRDLDTARIAIQASLTGHLVFSTLHTNDAAGAVARLIDLGIEPYLVASSLSAVVAQRLVRLVHQPCGGDGCAACFSTGYAGRRGLFELLAIDAAMRALISSGASLGEVRDAAAAGGMRTLVDEGRRIVEEGWTTPLEVQRLVQVER